MGDIKHKGLITAIKFLEEKYGDSLVYNGWDSGDIFFAINDKSHEGFIDENGIWYYNRPGQVPNGEYILRFDK